MSWWEHSDVNGCSDLAEYHPVVEWFACPICGIERSLADVQAWRATADNLNREVSRLRNRGYTGPQIDDLMKEDGHA